MSLQQLCSNTLANSVLNTYNIDYINALNTMCKKIVLYEINLIEKIRKIIDNMFNYIVDGYTIIDRSVNDCDEYGYIYDVYCKNGFDGQQHDIQPAIFYDKMMFLKKLVDYGLYIEGKRYYIHELILFDRYKIKFINENEFFSRKDRSAKILENINEIKKIHRSTLQKWKYTRDINYNLLFCYNKNYFYKSLYIIENLSSLAYMYKRGKIEFSDDLTRYIKINSKYFDEVYKIT